MIRKNTTTFTIWIAVIAAISFTNTIFATKANAENFKIPATAKKLFSCELRHIDFGNTFEINFPGNAQQKDFYEMRPDETLVLRHSQFELFYGYEGYSARIKYPVEGRKKMQTCEVSLKASYMSDSQIEEEIKVFEDDLKAKEAFFAEKETFLAEKPGFGKNGFMMESIALTRRTLAKLKDAKKKDLFMQEMYWGSPDGTGCDISLHVYSVFEGIIGITGFAKWPHVNAICEDNTTVVYPLMP